MRIKTKISDFKTASVECFNRIDDYTDGSASDLMMGLALGAYISLSLFGTITSSAYLEKLTDGPARNTQSVKTKNVSDFDCK